MGNVLCTCDGYTTTPTPGPLVSEQVIACWCGIIFQKIRKSKLYSLLSRLISSGGRKLHLVLKIRYFGVIWQYFFLIVYVVLERLVVFVHVTKTYGGMVSCFTPGDRSLGVQWMMAWEVVWMLGEEKHLLSLPRIEPKFLYCPATSPGCCTKYAGLVWSIHSVC